MLIIQGQLLTIEFDPEQIINVSTQLKDNSLLK